MRLGGLIVLEGIVLNPYLNETLSVQIHAVLTAAGISCDPWY